MKNLMPGDTISNQVTVANTSGRSVTVYLKAYPEFIGSADGLEATRVRTESNGALSTASADGKTFRSDILDQISMTLRLGDEILYQGSADGENPDEGYEAMVNGDYGISLGSFASNTQETMTIELTLPGPTFDNSFESKFDAVDWVFCVEGTTPRFVRRRKQRRRWRRKQYRKRTLQPFRKRYFLLPGGHNRRRRNQYRGDGPGSFPCFHSQTGRYGNQRIRIWNCSGTVACLHRHLYEKTPGTRLV